jgi:hypothetical protein
MAASPRLVLLEEILIRQEGRREAEAGSPLPPLASSRCVGTGITIRCDAAGLDRRYHVITLEYRGLAPRGIFVKGRPYGTEGTVV